MTATAPLFSTPITEADPWLGLLGAEWGLYGTPSRWCIRNPRGAYRLALGERWRPGPLAVWIGCNPSVANEARTDMTNTKIRRFTERLMLCAGFGGFVIVNLISIVATDPTTITNFGAHSFDMAALSAAYGPHAKLVVAAWGTLGPRLQEITRPAREHVAALARKHRESLPTVCFGTTKSGEPRHPSRLPYASKWSPWSGGVS